MPDKDGQGEDGVDWLASQLGGGARPTAPDQFVPRKGTPRRPKNAPVEPAVAEDAAPKTAGFLWGLKPTTEAGNRAAAMDAATPPAPTPAPTPAAPPPLGVRNESGDPALPAAAPMRRAPEAPTPARLTDHTGPPPDSPATDAPILPSVPAARAARSEADLEPAPWWTTQPQSPLVPTAEETAAAAGLGAPAAPVAATPTPAPVPATGLRRFRARPAAPAAAPAPAAAEDDAPTAQLHAAGIPPVETPRVEPAPVENPPVEPAPVEPAPVETAPAETPSILRPAEISEHAPTVAMPAQPDATAPERATTETLQTRRQAKAAEAAEADQSGPTPFAAPTMAMPSTTPTPFAAPTMATPSKPDAAGRRRGPGGRPPAAPGGPGRIPPRLLWIAGALVAVLVLVGLFFLGRLLVAGPAPVAVATTSAAPTPTPTPTPTPEPTGPQPVGVHQWNTLFGGECLQPYVSPWEEEFTVADCAAPHAAQLVTRGTFPGDAAAEFPGEEALASQINLLCSATGVIDLTAAGEYPDVQVQGSYPVTAEQWAASPHYYYCFVNRSTGEPLTASVAGPGPAPAG